MKKFEYLFEKNIKNIDIELKSSKNILTNNILKSCKRYDEGFDDLNSQIKGLRELMDVYKVSILNLEKVCINKNEKVAKKEDEKANYIDSGKELN